MANIWHHFHVGNGVLSRNEIVNTIGKAGVETYPLDPTSPQGPGILVFDEVSTGLCRHLQEVSNRGTERVIAVAVSQSAMPPGIWNLLQAGASDVLNWCDGMTCAFQIARRFERWNTVDQLLDSPIVKKTLIGKCYCWRSILRQIVEVARFTEAPVLITGESGTGKEAAARLIHALDQRPGKPEIVILDCTTVVPGLAGSEFFGHEKGAFTGAGAPREGAFAMADGGTLFLDEVGELPLELQAQLLRVVQEKTYKRIGGNTWRNTNFRLVCATNRDLPEEVRRGKFRTDLYYRIAGWTCRLPPLRERTEDILPLARHFMEQASPQGISPEFDNPVEEYLHRREYPGNVRDLKQLVTRIMYRHVGQGPISVGDIPEEERPCNDAIPFDWCDASFEQVIRNALLLGTGLKEIGKIAEDTAVRIAVNAEEGNLQRAAKRLGVTDRALQLRRASRRTQ